MQHHTRTRLLLLLLVITAWSPAARAGDGGGGSAPGLSSQQAQRIIAARSRNALQAIRDRNMGRLATYVHPRRGLRFSPYVAAAREDRRLTRRQVRNLGRTQQRYFWGYFDGTGDPIRQTWRQYYQRFVYARDFARAPQTHYSVLAQRGNTTNTLGQTYPGAIFVEYHFPASSKELDWRSLWLVWQKHGATWYLTGIANDEWTI